MNSKIISFVVLLSAIAVIAILKHADAESNWPNPTDQRNEGVLLIFLMFAVGCILILISLISFFHVVVRFFRHPKRPHEIKDGMIVSTLYLISSFILIYDMFLRK